MLFRSLYDSCSSTSITTPFLGKTVYLDTITVSSYNGGYGLGTYNLYSSSYYKLNLNTKTDLFNTSFNDIGGHWSPSNYTSGVYNLTTSYINPNYFGDWLIIQFPNPVVLSRYRFYPRTNNPNRVPGLFRFYGSTDGITFNLIPARSI